MDNVTIFWLQLVLSCVVCALTAKWYVWHPWHPFLFDSRSAAHLRPPITDVSSWPSAHVPNPHFKPSTRAGIP